MSEKGELVSLSSKKVQSIKLGYSTLNLTKFGTRAQAKGKSKFTFKTKGNKIETADIFDIWLSPLK